MTPEKEKIQTTPDDAANQAAAMAPATAVMAAEDPELLVKLTRVQLAVVQDRMVKKVLGDAQATIGMYAQVHERLSKNARIEKSEGPTQATGAQVVINFIRAPGKPAVTIEGSAVTVEDQATDVTPA